jgi:hypothetical protein
LRVSIGGGNGDGDGRRELNSDSFASFHIHHLRGFLEKHHHCGRTE